MAKIMVEGLLVSLGEEQLFVQFALRFEIKQTVIAQLASGKSINRFLIAKRFGKRREQQRHSGQALLAVCL